MANVHVSGSGNPNLTVGGTSNARISTGNTTMPKYVGARAYVEQTENGATITVIDKDGTTTANVLNGAAGATGADGFSPSATVEKVGDTATITITDKDGTTTAQISDGDANVQADWNESDSTSDAYIANKPGVATSSTNGLMPSSDKSKLDSIVMNNGIIDPSNLPSYVDDVVEAYGRASATPLAADWLSLTNGGAALTPERGKIYILMYDHDEYMANQQFRWSGSAYVPISSSGGSSGVFIADYGQTSYDDVLYAMSHGSVAFCRVNSSTDTKLARVVNYKNVDGTIVFTFKYVHGCLEGTITVDPDNGWNDTHSYIQSNWAESDTTSPTYIQNKPPLTITSYMYPGDKMKIAEIALTNSTPTALYASEWLIAVYNTTSYADAKNAFDADRDIVCKYTSSGTTWYIPLVDYDSANETFHFSTVRNNTEILCTLRNNAGWSYSETVMSGTQSDWNQTTTTAADYIKNKPTIPSKVSDLTNDSGFITASDVPVEVFWATYGTTTYQQMVGAIEDGYHVVLKNGFEYTPLTNANNNTFTFVNVSGNGDTKVMALNFTNGWSTQTFDNQRIYYAIYGTTTNAELEAALTAGKLICAIYQSSILTYFSQRVAQNSHDFVGIAWGSPVTLHCLKCDNNQWSHSQTSIPELDSNGKIDATYLPVYSGGVSP